jgi:hypothetical protein
MPLEYDPLLSAFTVDAVIPINGTDTNCIVTAFSRNGKAATGPDFSNSDGSYRGARRVKGAEDANMTVEIENAAQGTPMQFGSFEYDGSNWAVFQASKSISSTSAGTYTLTLRCEDIPGTVSALTLGSGGTGYTSGTLIFTGGGGSGAAGTFIAASGIITSVTLTSGGSGYTTAPTISAAAGSGASITAAIISPDA